MGAHDGRIKAMQAASTTSRPLFLPAVAAIAAAGAALALPLGDAGPAATPAPEAPAHRAGAQQGTVDRAQAEVPARLAAERELAARVDDDRAARLVRELVSLGPRMGGTASGERAADRVAEEFADIGLRTVRHLARPRWCHGETAWTVTATVEGEEPFELERAWPLGFSPASQGTATLTMDAEAADAATSALLADGWRPRRGDEPLALVLDHGRTTKDGAWPICRSHPRRQRARTPAFGIDRPAAERLQRALQAGRAVTVEWSLETVVAEARPITVVAVLPAREDAAPGHFLVCAHGDSDSGGPGANDNASGVAIVLEMARAWHAAVEAGDLEAPPIEVRFAVWGTEIHSTRDYMESDLGAGLAGVLNFDQAGFGSTGQRLHVEPDDLPANERFVLTAAEVLADHAGAEGFPERWATNKSLGGTDSYVFSGSRRFRDDGLPSATMFTSAWDELDEHPRTEGMPGESWNDGHTVTVDYDLHYHSAGDTPENTTDKEPENMGWCARVGMIAILRHLGQS